MIGEILTGIEVATKVYAGGRWVQRNIRRRRGHLSSGPVDKDNPLQAVYFSLTKDAGTWRKFWLGREGFKEENRLRQGHSELISYYSGLKRGLLADKHIGPMPYEVLSTDTQEIGLSVLDTSFTLPSALRSLYDATQVSLVSHFRRMGIQYTPTYLARACDWDKKAKTLSVEKVSYTVAAATNMIADLNLTAALGNTVLLEGQTEAANSIRDYELSLSKKPRCFPPLQDSSLANPIGVAGIALTADDRLILTHRSRSVSSYASKLGPSSSGYVTWNDVSESKDKDSLDSVLVRALKREIAEELHLDLSRDISDLRSLGLYREMYRAGMPQAFYYFRTRLTAEQLVSLMRDSQDFSEAIGVLAIPVNRAALTKIISALIRLQKIGPLDVGLEAQGLLTALVRNGEEFIFRS